jgi:hypothetical protein
MLLSSILLVGCKPQAAPTDPNVAQQSLETMLKAWKDGGKSADLKSGQPEIIAVDDDWDSGVKLKSYRSIGTPFDDGKNLHCTIELTLVTKAGREYKREIVYIVGTSPVITIFRR